MIKWYTLVCKKSLEKVSFFGKNCNNVTIHLQVEIASIAGIFLLFRSSPTLASCRLEVDVSYSLIPEILNYDDTYQLEIIQHPNYKLRLDEMQKSSQCKKRNC